MRIPRLITIIGLAISVVIWAVGLVSASQAVRVAILDSGCDIAYLEGISLIDGTVKDYKGHGTLMASIIRQTCPQAQLYIVKVVEKDGLILDEEAVILGLEWAISRNVDVINMSLRLKDSERLHEVIRKAYRQGIVIVAAAGNNSTRMGLACNFAQAGAVSLTEVAYPAKYSEVIAVGALNQYGKIYNQSAQSEEVDLYFRGYRGRSAGTSIASAYAAGTMARVISENPKASLEELKNIILITPRSNSLPKKKDTRQ